MHKLNVAGMLAAVLCAPAIAQAVTPNSACGAPATGYRHGTREPVTLDAAAAQYLQVGPDGVWRFCRPVPAAPRAPADCTPPARPTWGESEQTCSGVGPATVKHGALAVVRTSPGTLDGLLVLQCSDGALIVRVSTCDPAVECVGSYTGTDDGGATVWQWTGRLREGSRGVATSGVRTRPIECLGGQLRLR